jgi:hypothetical protein
VAAITAILARYPEAVITEVTHPATGLPKKKGWLPTVKEVSDACEDAVEFSVQHAARLKRIQDQMEARAREDRGEKPTLAQLKERFGDNWGIEEPSKRKGEVVKAPTIDQLRHHYQHYGLGFSPKEELAEHIERGFSPSTAE